MHADLELLPDGGVSFPTHGGRRAGAGRKPADYVKPDEVVDYEKARARNEQAKAELNELDLKIKSGQYVSRASVQQASATALATLAQGMRSISDNLERRGVPPEVCVQVEAIINEGMADVARDLELMSSGG